MIKIGLDTFTIRDLNLDPFQILDYVKAHELEGAQFGSLRQISPSLDPGYLKEIRAHADRLGLYSHVSVGTCNPHFTGKSREEQIADLTAEIETAAACGWHELHSCLGGPDERYRHKIPWPQQLADSSEFIRELGPVLRAHGSRINLETHGDATTFELVRLIESAVADVAGICLDTANVLVFAEDPIAAARRAAPYTHLTHTKDGILYFSEHGLMRQGRPPGQGCLDWEKILPILHEQQPNLPLSIEDHKWLFEIRIFDPEWHAHHPDLNSIELAECVRLARIGQRKIDRGEWPEPEEYERVPYLEEMEERLAAGRDYLKVKIKEIIDI